MSQVYRSRIAQLLAQDKKLGMNEEEKQDILGWCPISDDVVRDIMRKDRIKGNIDDYLQTVSDADIMEIHARVMEIYRMRKKKRKSTIDMLEREGTAHAQAQADRLKEEQKQEDAAVQEVQEH